MAEEDGDNWQDFRERNPVPTLPVDAYVPWSVSVAKLTLSSPSIKQEDRVKGSGSSKSCMKSCYYN